MVPHTRRSGSSLPLRNPSQIMRRQGPERNMGVHAATQHFNPNPYNDKSSTAPHPLRQCTTKYRSAQPPKTRLSSDHNPYNDETSTAPHTHFGGFPHSVKPLSKESVDKARAKYGHARSHPGPQPLRIPNPHNDKSSTAPHTHFGGCIRSVLSPSVKPNPENAQTMHHETQECAATQDPDSRVPTTHMTTKQVRCHTPALVGFLTLQNPHPKNPWARPGRNTGMRAATQDPDSRLFATNTMRWPQIRSHTPAEAVCTMVLSPSAQPHLKNATQDPNPEYQ
ncbi:hypothetical protein BS47DRAFT_1368590 [Hydnum rufescens UP504]|uniref:Uncharacterized protein n=1 Tax=Hydnum rufescens UP504 TaxID=1448309 RepID=A0A9P6AF20_9AGAM|nr:hypothetical protein BS47DRAFT_1368590 [Hydnum rufescens UP504]